MNLVLNCTVLLMLITHLYGNTFDDNTDDQEEEDNTEVRPTVKVINLNPATPWQEDWDIIDFKNGKTNLVSKHRNNLVLHLECTAPYDVKWITGGTQHLKMTKLGDNNRAKVCGTFPESINGTMLYSRTLSLSFPPNLTSAVGEIRCERRIRIRTTNTKVAIFIPGEKALLHNGQNVTYDEMDSFIECPNTNPRISVDLFSQDPQTSALKMLKNITYDPVNGFREIKNRTAIYICVASDKSSARFVPNNLQKIVSKPIQIIPKVEIKDFASDKPWQDDWEVIDLNNNATNLIAKHNNKPVLHLFCYSIENIVWLFNPEFDSDVNNVIDCDSFLEQFQGELFFSRVLSVRFQAGAGSIANIRCEHQHNFDAAKINVFFPGSVEKPLINSGQSLKYYNHRDHIECPTSNPKIPVTLWSEDSKSGTTTQIKDAVYNPAVGFKVQEKHGIYVCLSGKNDEVRFVQDEIGGSQLEHSLTETPTEVTFFIKSQDISSRCGQNEYNNVFVVQGGVKDVGDNRRTVINSTGTNLWLEETKFDLQINSTFKTWNIVDVFCVRDDININGNSKRGKVLSKWSVSTIRRNVTDQFNPATDDESYYSVSNEANSYGRLAWEHFTVDEDVFTISDGGYTMYSNYTSNFTCKTGSKLANLTFWIELVNGTRVHLKNDPSKFVKVEVDQREFLKFKTWKLSIRLPVEAVAVICEIPYNSHPTLYLSAERRFRTAYLSPPVILNGRAANTTLQFTVGELHHHLICECTAEPQPKYTWFKDNREILDLKLRVTVDHNGNGLLEFPSMKKSYEGIYSCYAKNDLGSDSYNFTVSVQEIVKEESSHQISTSSGNHIELIISIFCFIVALVVLGLAVHHYYKTKNLVQKSNDQELNVLM